MTLSAMGEALTPAGGSVCMRLKSRIRRRRAAVDMVRLSAREARERCCWWKLGGMRAESRYG